MNDAPSLPTASQIQALSNAIRLHLEAAEMADQMPAIRYEPDAFTQTEGVIRYTVKGVEHGIAYTLPKTGKGPGVEDAAALSAAAALMMTHLRHADTICAAMASVEKRARKRFEALGCTVESPEFIWAHMDGDTVTSIDTYCGLHILGDDYLPQSVMLQLREPYAKTDGFDGWRIYARTQRQRMRALGGRKRIDVLSVCPIALEVALTNDVDRQALLEGMEAILSPAINDRTPRDKGRISNIEASEGRVIATVTFGPATWRNRTLMAHDMSVPETIAAASIGRPLTDLVGNDQFADLIVHKASNHKKKKRFDVVVAPFAGVPLRQAIDMCRQGDAR